MANTDTPRGRFHPPDAIPWRDRFHTDPVAAALVARGATDAEAADVYASQVDRLTRELLRVRELTAVPLRVVLAPPTARAEAPTDHERALLEFFHGGRSPRAG